MPRSRFVLSSLLVTGCAAHDAAPPDAPDERDTAAQQASQDAGGAQIEGGLAGARPDAGAAHCGEGTFCADFEDQRGPSLGAPFIAVAPNCSGDGKVAIDSQVAHGGRQALRITSSGGYCNHVFAEPTLPAGLLARPTWVRFYVRFDEALSDAHVTFLTMRDRVSGKDLRLGGQSRILMWNRESDDATLPELSPTGIGLSRAPMPKRWSCLEFRVDGAQGALETFLDGEPIPGLVIDETPTPEIDRQWLRPGRFRAELDTLRVGWESYGSQRMTVWIDDLVVGAARPGC